MHCQFWQANKFHFFAISMLFQCICACAHVMKTCIMLHVLKTVKHFNSKQESPILGPRAIATSYHFGIIIWLVIIPSAGFLYLHEYMCTQCNEAQKQAFKPNTQIQN